MTICQCGTHALTDAKDLAVSKLDEKLDDLLFARTSLGIYNRPIDYDKKYRAINSKMLRLRACRAVLLHRHYTGTN